MEKFDETIFGEFNDYPPNWKSITEDAFWHKWCSRSWSQEEFRQMMNPKEVHDGMPQKFVTCSRLFLYSDGTGLAMVFQVEKAHYTRPVFYQFAQCEHDWQYVPEKSRMCYTVSRCEKCGIEKGVDSSD